MEIIDFVKEKFADKFDKGGNPYFDHLERVAGSSWNLHIYKSLEEVNKLYKIGLLHDILEDTDTTKEELISLNFVDDTIIEAVVALTRQENESYMDYIRRLSSNRYARMVKIYDLRDNMDITRLPKLTKGTFDSLKKYHKAWKYLIEIENQYE